MTPEEKAKLMEQLKDPEALNEILQAQGLKTVAIKSNTSELKVKPLKLSEDFTTSELTSQLNSILSDLATQMSKQVSTTATTLREEREKAETEAHNKKIDAFAKSHPLMSEADFIAVMDVEYQKSGDLEAAYTYAKTTLNRNDPKGKDEDKTKTKNKPKSKATDPGQTVPPDVDEDLDDDELDTKVPKDREEAIKFNLDKILAKRDDNPFGEDE